MVHTTHSQYVLVTLLMNRTSRRLYYIVKTRSYYKAIHTFTIYTDIILSLRWAKVHPNCYARMSLLIRSVWKTDLSTEVYRTQQHYVHVEIMGELKKGISLLQHVRMMNGDNKQWMERLPCFDYWRLLCSEIVQRYVQGTFIPNRKPIKDFEI